MKRLIITGSLITGTFVLLRRFGPTLAERCMTKCREILDGLPDDSALKRLLRRNVRQGDDAQYANNQPEQQSLVGTSVAR